MATTKDTRFAPQAIHVILQPSNFLTANVSVVDPESFAMVSDVRVLINPVGVICPHLVRNEMTRNGWTHDLHVKAINPACEICLIKQSDVCELPYHVEDSDVVPRLLRSVLMIDYDDGGFVGSPFSAKVEVAGMGTSREYTVRTTLVNQCPYIQYRTVAKENGKFEVIRSHPYVVEKRQFGCDICKYLTRDVAPLVFEQSDRTPLVGHEVKVRRVWLGGRKSRFNFPPPPPTFPRDIGRARLQMDSLLGAARNFACTVTGGLLEEGAELLGKGSKLAYGMTHDSAAMPRVDAGNMALCDLPRETYGLGFKSGDIKCDESRAVSEVLGLDNGNLLARMQIPSLQRPYIWTTSQTIGTSLVSANYPGEGINVSPATPSLQYIIAPYTYTYNTALSGLAGFYALWRGSLIYTIEVICTKFHQGQLWISFCPGDNYPSMTFSSSRTCAGVHLDLKLQNKTTFEVPFMSDQDYLGVDDAIGKLRIFIQNPLTCPENVANTVDINVWVSAGDDFEFVSPVSGVCEFKVQESWTASATPTIVEQGDEVVVDTKTEASTGARPSGIVDRTHENVRLVANIANADVMVTVGREYLLATGIEWTTSQAYESRVFTIDIAKAFGQEVLALSGLLKYHQFFRSDIELSISINANPMMSGLMIVYSYPAEVGSFYTTTETNQFLPTLTQLGAVFITPQTDTRVTLRVPWTHARRVVTTDKISSTAADKALGLLCGTVISPLRTGTGGPTKLTLSVWGRLVDPYVGVKKVPNPAATFDKLNVYHQGEMDVTSQPNVTDRGGVKVRATSSTDSTDSSQVPGSAERLYGSQGPFETGFLRTRHMNAYELLRRPCHYATIAESAGSKISYLLPIGGYAMTGTLFEYIRTLYRHWSGSMRYHFMNNIRQSDAGVLGTAYRNYYSGSLQPASTTAAVTMHDLAGGASMNRITLENGFIVQTPYYCPTGIRYNPSVASLNAAELDAANAGVILVWSGQNGATGTGNKYYVFQSIGDDFRFYHPMPFGMFRTHSSTRKVTRSNVRRRRQSTDSDWVRDLTDEGIEPNPGPFDTIALSEGELVELMDCVAELVDADLPDIRSISEQGLVDYVSEKSRSAIEMVLGRLGLSAKSQIKDSVTSLRDELMSNIVPALSFAFDVLTHLYLAIRTGCTTLRNIALVALGLKAMTFWKTGKPMLEQLTEALTALLGPREQGLLDTIENDRSHIEIAAVSVASIIAAGIVSYCGWTMTTTDMRDIRNTTLWKIAESGSIIGKVRSGVTALPDLWKSCRAACLAALDWFLYGKEINEDWQVRNEKKLHKWMEVATKSTVESWWTGSAAIEKRDDLKELVDFAREIMLMGAPLKGFPACYVRKASEIISQSPSLMAMEKQSAPRPEPIGIWLYGEPGSGKSVFASTVLPRILLEKTGFVGKQNSSINQYSKPNTVDHTFMDGYRGQKYVLVDDFLTLADGDDAACMMQFISSASAPVRMAAIEEKNTIFESPFVVVTTNQRSLQTVRGLNNPEAIERRFPFAVKLSPSQEFRTGAFFDCVKFSEEAENCHTSQDIISLCDRAFVLTRIRLSGANTDSRTTFSAWIQDVVNLYHLRQNNFSRIRDALDRAVGGQTVKEPKSGFRGPELTIPPLELRVDRLEENLKSVKVKEFGDGTINPGLPDLDSIFAISSPNLEVLLQGDTDDEYESSEEGDPWIYPGGSERWNGTSSFNSVFSQQRVEADTNRRILVSEASDLELDDDGGKKRATTLWNLLMSTPTVYGYWNKETLNSDVVAGPGEGNSVSDAIFLRSALKVKKISEKVDDENKTSWAGLLKWLVGAAVVATATAAIIAGVIHGFRSYFSRTIECFVDEQKYDPTSKKNIVLRKVGRVPRIPVRVGVVQQGDDVVLTDKDQKLRKNVRRIRVAVDGKDTARMWAVALDIDTLIVPDHFRKKVFENPDSQCFILQMSALGEELDWVPFECGKSNSRQIVEVGIFDGHRDAALVCGIGTAVLSARSIWHLVVLRKYMEKCANYNAACTFLKPHNAKDARVLLNHMFTLERDGGTVNCFGANVTSSTVQGDCGVPYSFSQNQRRPFFGIHVWGFASGDIDTGIAPFTYESLVETREAIKMAFPVNVPVEEVVLEEADFSFRPVHHKYIKAGSVDFLGSGEWRGAKLERFQPTTTEFVRSGWDHKIWLDEYLPTQKTPLTIGDREVHPLYLNAEKYENKAIKTVSAGTHARVVRYMCEKFGRLRITEALTEDEMINGTGIMPGIVMSTGSGFLQPGFAAGKKEFFDLIPPDEPGRPDKYTFSDAAREKRTCVGLSLVDLVKLNDDRISRGQLPETVWVAANKDELVKIAKVRVAKTRVFIQPTVDITLLMRKYFGRFLDEYKSRAGFDLCHAIGIDKDTEWKAIDSELNVHGVGFDVDYSNYDATIPESAFDAFTSLVTYSYGGRYSKQIRSLVESIRLSLVVLGNVAFRKTKGNNSGSPLTDCLNSVTNWYLILCAYLDLKEKSGSSGGLDDFRCDVSALTYGDDIIISASPQTLEYFNRVTYCEYARNLGMVVTAASKSGELIPYQDVGSLTFLKSSFKKIGDIISAPLPIDVIHRELIWTRKQNKDDELVKRQKISEAMDMVSHLGYAAHEELKEQLKSIGCPVTSVWEDWYEEMIKKQETSRIGYGNHPLYRISEFRETGVPSHELIVADTMPEEDDDEGPTGWDF